MLRITTARSEVLLAKAQRAFKAMDAAENGYISKDQFEAVLSELSDEISSPIDPNGVSVRHHTTAVLGQGKRVF
jgi:hypothetical protein